MPHPSILPFVFLLFVSVNIFCVPTTWAKGSADASAQVLKFAYPLIDDIVFQGNKVTQPEVLAQEMTVVIGDPADPEKIAESQQAIMDLNLYKSVVIDQEVTEEGVILQVKVEEKIYILPLPTLGRSNDGDISYGVNIKWYNMLGLNHTFKAKAKVNNFADGDMDTKKFIAIEYSLPRLNGGPWELKMFGDYSRNRIYAQDDGHSSYKQAAWFSGVSLRRWLHLEGPSRGWFTWGNGTLTHKSHMVDIGTPDLYEDGTQIQFSLGGGYKTIHDHLFSRTGKEFGYTFGIGHSPVDSESLFTSHYFYYRLYHWLFGKSHHNLNFQFQAAFASDSLYQEYNYKLGSSKTLRGYDRDSLQGNAYLLANIEYLHPLLDNNPFRGVIFADIGNSWQSMEDVDPSDLEASVGFGLRTKVKYFVKLDLILEWAFSADGENKVYAGTSLPF